MRIAVLEAGLFPDAGTLDAALARLEEDHAVVRLEAVRQGMDEEDWDRLLEAILASDLVVTT